MGAHLVSQVGDKPEEGRGVWGPSSAYSRSPVPSVVGVRGLPEAGGQGFLLGRWSPAMW